MAKLSYSCFELDILRFGYDGCLVGKTDILRFGYDGCLVGKTLRGNG